MTVDLHELVECLYDDTADVVEIADFVVLVNLAITFRAWVDSTGGQPTYLLMRRLHELVDSIDFTGVPEQLEMPA